MHHLSQGFKAAKRGLNHTFHASDISYSTYTSSSALSGTSCASRHWSPRPDRPCNHEPARRHLPVHAFLWPRRKRECWGRAGALARGGARATSRRDVATGSACWGKPRCACPVDGPRQTARWSLLHIKLVFELTYGAMRRCAVVLPCHLMRLLCTCDSLFPPDTNVDHGTPAGAPLPDGRHW